MNSQQAYPGVNVAWFIPLRLITFSFVFGAIIIWLGFPSYLQGPFLIYSLITLASLLTLVMYKRFRLHFLLKCFIGLHFFLEIVNEAGIVYSTGSYYSPFSALFLLTIVSTALLYRLIGTLMIATIVSIAYAIVTWLNITPPALGGLMGRAGAVTPLNADDAYFYSTFLHILIFYLVAFISGFLAEKLRSKNIELDSASAALKKARLETGDILWHLNCGLITVDNSGTIVYFNRIAQSILGIMESEVSGHSCSEVFCGQLSPLRDNLLTVLNSKTRLSRTEFSIIRDDGTEIPLGLSTSTLYDENFETRGVIAIFQDLTEAKLLNRKIRHADKMAAVGELSACIAHEIRNPLAAISGSVELLKSDLVLVGDNEKLMSLILKESTRLNKILSDFLLYARVGRPEFRKVEIIGLISEVIEITRQHPSFHQGIGIDLQYQDHTTYVSGDEDQLKQLLLNLMVNACEAIGKDHGRVQLVIQCGRRDLDVDTVCVSVRDSGIGIPDTTMKDIFLPFHSTKKGGTGLGLAIVARLAESLGGRVEVSSSAGIGTEFRLYLRSISDESGKSGSSAPQQQAVNA